MSKNLAKIYSNHSNDDYEGFSETFIKTKRKNEESVEVKRSKNCTTTRFKSKKPSNYQLDEDFYY